MLLLLFIEKTNCKVHDTFPNYLEWRFMSKSNWVVFEECKMSNCSKLVITNNIDVKEEFDFFEFLIMCSYFYKCEYLEIRKIVLPSKRYYDIISLFSNLKTLILKGIYIFLLLLYM